MSRTFAGAAAALILAIAGAPGASAAPTGGPQSLIGTAAQNSLVQQVHRCHRRWREGRAGWHKHVGRSCRRVGRHARRHHRGKRYWYRGARCDTYCVGIGPLRVCDRDCD